MDQQLILQARRADLSEFLLRFHRDAFRVVGNSLVFREHDSLSIKIGYSGYSRFSSQETGNSIDFLVRYLGYSFRDAVAALAGQAEPSLHSMSPSAGSTQICLPDRDDPPFSRVFAYMTIRRGIPADMVRQLFLEGLLYQEKLTGNAVFINRGRNFCELRGTNTFRSRPFHGIRRAGPACFWGISSSGHPETAFVCEGAVDALSLMLLHRKKGVSGAFLYAGIGGVANQQTIDCIHSSIHTILAVDNDTAGQLCRDRNPDLEAVVPEMKDWNDDWLAVLSSAQHCFV